MPWYLYPNTIHIVNTYVLLEMLLGGVHKLKGSELVTLSLETLDDFTNETALDAYYMIEGQYGGLDEFSYAWKRNLYRQAWP